MSSINIKQANLTSTLLTVSNQEDQLAALASFLSNNKLIKINVEQVRAGSLHNLQLYNQDQEGFKIKTVREIIEASSFGSYDSQLRVFAILHAQQASIPAQNALLKIIEEPPANSLVILVTAYPKQLLPTIHSRCIRVNADKSTKDEQQIGYSAAESRVYPPEITDIAKQLLASNFNLAQAIDLAENYKKREQGLELTQNLIDYLHQQLAAQSQHKLARSNTPSKEKIRHAIEQLLGAHQALLKNLNPQLTLEHHFFKIVNFSG